MMDPQLILKQLHRARSVKERTRLISEAEQEGYHVAFKSDRYILSANGTDHHLPDKVCERCGSTRLLSDYWGSQGAELPWCSCCKSQLSGSRNYVRNADSTIDKCSVFEMS